jgi:hypothetical protein
MGDVWDGSTLLKPVDEICSHADLFQVVMFDMLND